jgi:hypothetical protein
MMDCKSMDTPMNTEIRKVKDPDSDPVDPSLYRQLIGSLMYLVNTRPDILFAVNTLSQFQVEPRHKHWIVAKHVLRYICGTINYGLRYTASSDIQLPAIHRLRLGRKCRRRKEHFKHVFQLGLCNDILGQKETEVYRTQQSISQHVKHAQKQFG